MDALFDSSRAHDDFAGPRFVLWWDGPSQERAVNRLSNLLYYVPDFSALVHDVLFVGVPIGFSRDRWSGSILAYWWPRLGESILSGEDWRDNCTPLSSFHPGDSFYDVSDDVRNHHRSDCVRLLRR